VVFQSKIYTRPLNYTLEAPVLHTFFPKHLTLRPPPDRPPVVGLAVRLSWMSLLLGTLNSIYSIGVAPGIAAMENGIVVLVLTVCITVVMVLAIVGISNGRNWARKLSIAFFVLGLHGAISRLDEIVSGPTVYFVFDIAIYLIDSIVLFLIYSRPGALWFRPTNDYAKSL